MKKLACLLACLYVYFLPTLHAQDKNALFPMPNAQGKWGYVDAQNKVIIPYQFDDASPFHEERAFVLRYKDKEELYSVIDTKGNIIFNTTMLGYRARWLCQMHEHRYSEGLYKIEETVGDKTIYKYLDKAGKVALTLHNDTALFTTADNFSEGLAYGMLNDDVWVYFDKKGKIVLKGYGYTDVIGREFHEGWAVQGFLPREQRFAYINQKGEKASFLDKYEVLDLGNMNEGYAFMALNNSTAEKQSLAYVVLQPDRSVKPIDLPVAYSSPITCISGYSFSHGLALVQCQEDGYTWEYINTAGKRAFQLPKKLRNVTTDTHEVSGDNFHNGLACWVVMRRYDAMEIIFLDTAGKIVMKSPIVKR
jgi:hypothetical protein